MTTPSLSLVVPVYNEAELLPVFLAECHEFLRGHFRDYEIILVESGSTDGTGEEADRLAQGSRAVRVIHEGRRNGFGAALRVGFAAATKDLVLMQTADSAYPMATLIDALPLIREYDCVLSYRTSDDRSVYRRVQSAVYNWLVKRALGLRCRHVNAAFKLYRREIIQSLPLVSRGWLIDAEIILRLQQRNARTTAVPIPLRDRTAGRSTVGWRTSLRQLRDLYTFVRRHKNAA